MPKKRRMSTSLSAQPIGPVRIGEILPQLMSRYGFQRHKANEEIQNVWNSVVAEFLPSSLCPHALLGDVRRGVLTVKVEHVALVQELSLYEPQLVEEIQRRLPDTKIKRIKFSVM
ncbi:MAG: DUF721 domain-containing protein [Thermoguttaceae bacterium]